jgi:hypothetical protein
MTPLLALIPTPTAPFRGGKTKLLEASKRKKQELGEDYEAFQEKQKDGKSRLSSYKKLLYSRMNGLLREQLLTCRTTQLPKRTEARDSRGSRSRARIRARIRARNKKG